MMIQMAESGLLPDGLVRLGIRRLLRHCLLYTSPSPRD